MRRRARVFAAIVSLLVLYTGLQVGRLLPAAPPWAVWAATVGYFWLVLGWLAAYRRPGALAAPWFPALAWTASIAFGVWAGFLAFSLPLDAGALAGAGWAGPSASAAAAAASAASALLGLLQAARGPIVRRVEVRIAGLPAALEGLRIAHVTDLHVGPTIRLGYVERVAREIERLKPDLVALTGDIGDGAVESLRAQMAPLARLKAPLGAYFVTGNHEYYWGASAWLAEFRRLGLTPLVDEGRLVERGGAAVLVAGVSDPDGRYFPEGHRSDARRAAAGGERAALRILLAHRPGTSEEAARAGFHLQLSGHTHGGQFFPFNLLIRLFHRHHRGLSREGPLWVYVNPGTGYWGPPHRLGVPAEIALLEVKIEA
jgi:hypothetical protein